MIGLKDSLAHITFQEACKLLGPEGDRLIRAGGKYHVDMSEHIVLKGDLFRLDLGEAVVTIRLDPEKERELNCRCSMCDISCEHMGAALSIILEEKLVLGLSSPPPERVPVESLTDEELVKQAIMDRAERASKENMTVQSMSKSELWIDYTVTNRASGKTYRVALRGWDRGESYCTCPDYRKNTLGTCKHIIHVLDIAKSTFIGEVCRTRHQQKDICVYIRYGRDLELGILIPERLDPQIAEIVEPLLEGPI